MLLTTRPSAGKLVMPSSHHHHQHHIATQQHSKKSKTNLNRKVSKLTVIGPPPPPHGGAVVWTNRIGHPATLLLTTTPSQHHGGGGSGGGGNHHGGHIPPPPPPPPPPPNHHHHHGGIRAVPVRKIVNPVTVNALKALSARVQGPPIPPQPLKQISYNTGASSGSCCSCCYYCCCDGLPKGNSSGNPAHNNKTRFNLTDCGGTTCSGCSCTCPSGGGNGKGLLKSKHTKSSPSARNGNVLHQRIHPHHNKVTIAHNRRRRSRSRSRETLLSSTTTTASVSCRHSQSVLDLSRLIISEQIQNDGLAGLGKPKFVPVTTLDDVQAVRCAEFHPRGHVYAVGSNSKTLRICAYPDVSHVTENQTPKEPQILFKRNKYHRGSIYCLGWSPDGNLLATGSNDKTVKLVRFDELNRQDKLTHSSEVELTMHDGTVRDICFIEDLSNKSSLLVSGGAGDCKIYVTDCVTATPFQSLAGHSAPVLSLYNWGGVIFASGSQDKTVRLWDLSTRGCVSVVSPLTNPNSTTIKSPVGSVCVDPTGRLLISGHEDSAISLYDIRGARQIQVINPHEGDVRSVRFSPNAYYLLSTGYDHRIIMTDLQGDLTQTIKSVTVASHDDKVISGRWHPKDFTILSTSADKTATLWALPKSSPSTAL